MAVYETSCEQCAELNRACKIRKGGRPGCRPRKWDKLCCSYRNTGTGIAAGAEKTSEKSYTAGIQDKAARASGIGGNDGNVAALEDTSLGDSPMAKGAVGGEPATGDEGGKETESVIVPNPRGTCDFCSGSELECLGIAGKGRACIACKVRKQSCTANGERLNRRRTQAHSQSDSVSPAPRRSVRRMPIPPTEEVSERDESELDPLVYGFCTRVLRLETALRREREIRKEMREETEARLQRLERNILSLMEEQAASKGLIVNLNLEGEGGASGSKVKGKGKEMVTEMETRSTGKGVEWMAEDEMRG